MKTLWWQTVGTGNCHLVLLHGWGLNAEVWHCISEELASQFTLHLVDLPGYGYAKVARSEKERWARLMETYFQREADAITTGVLIVDIRHKPTANDLVMHDWFRQTGCPEIVVANKLDKLKKSQVEPALSLIRDTLELAEGDALVPFSAEKGTGKEELIGLLNAACEE